MRKIILDLCGGTGSWSRPYKEAGYDVRLITLPDNDVLTYKLPIEPVYGILAAPPCTMFSLARTTPKTPRDFVGGMKVVNACLNLIWQARYRNRLAFWALENPSGYLRQFLGKPPYTFSPEMFGDRYSKHTDLWGYYNKPKEHPIKLTGKERQHLQKNIRQLPQLPKGYYKTFMGRKDAQARAITPRGFADAFFKANQ